jgi:ferrochelatase
MGREFVVAFQSRFGPAKWLGPATDETLVALAKAGTRRVAVVAPGFSADCLETLEELSIRGRESFVEAGGTDFAYLPCLNDRPAGIVMLRSILARELAGWIDPVTA